MIPAACGAVGIPFLKDDKAEREFSTGVAFLAILRSSTEEITSLIDILYVSLRDNASILMSRSATPARRTSLTVSVV